MKKEELLNILNVAADSISLHDGSLITFNRQESTLTFLFCIGEYHHLANHLEEYVDNVKNHIILSLTFNGIKNLEMDFDKDFQIDGCEIIRNEDINHSYELELYDYPYYGKICFSYETFSWDALEELSSSKLKKWNKNMEQQRR